MATGGVARLRNVPWEEVAPAAGAALVVLGAFMAYLVQRGRDDWLGVLPPGCAFDRAANDFYASYERWLTVQGVGVVVTVVLAAGFWWRPGADRLELPVTVGLALAWIAVYFGAVTVTVGIGPDWRPWVVTDLVAVTLLGAVRTRRMSWPWRLLVVADLVYLGLLLIGIQFVEHVVLTSQEIPELPRLRPLGILGWATTSALYFYLHRRTVRTDRRPPPLRPVWLLVVFGLLLPTVMMSAATLGWDGERILPKVGSCFHGQH